MRWERAAKCSYGCTTVKEIARWILNNQQCWFESNMDREILLKFAGRQAADMFEKKVIDAVQPRAKFIVNDLHDRGLQADIGAYAQQNKSEEEDKVIQDCEARAD